MGNPTILLTRVHFLLLSASYRGNGKASERCQVLTSYSLFKRMETTLE